MIHEVFGIRFKPENRIIFIGATKSGTSKRLADYFDVAFKTHHLESDLTRFMGQHMIWDFDIITLSVIDSDNMNDVYNSVSYWVRAYDTMNNGLNTKVQAYGSREKIIILDKYFLEKKPIIQIEKETGIGRHIISKIIKKVNSEVIIEYLLSIKRDPPFYIKMQ